MPVLPAQAFLCIDLDVNFANLLNQLKMQKSKTPFLPVIVLFLILNAFFIIAPAFFERFGIDRNVLIVSNVLYFVSNLIVFLMQKKAMQNANPNVFVRSVMAGTMIKMLIIAGAFIVYVLVAGKAINKPALYISIFLYFLYLAIEVTILMKMNKQKNA
jgi:hypothetical protein